MDIQQNIREGKYENKLPYPSKPTQKDIEEAMVNFTGNLQQLKTEKEVTEIRLMAEYRQAQNNYHLETHRLNKLFQSDLAEDFGVTGHPKEQKLFELAWEHGHSSGYSDVYNYYVDFVELIN